MGIKNKKEKIRKRALRYFRRARKRKEKQLAYEQYFKTGIKTVNFMGV